MLRQSFPHLPLINMFIISIPLLSVTCLCPVRQVNVFTTGSNAVVYLHIEQQIMHHCQICKCIFISDQPY